MKRDYSKFLTEDGRLNTRRLPRAVYIQLVGAYRQQGAVIAKVFYEHYWMWDLEEAERKAQAEGREVSRIELAEHILKSMDDNDWWEVMSAFEAELIEHFHESPQYWAELLDPVYDDQEAAGWTVRQ